MNCKKCIYLVKSSRRFDEIKCKKFINSQHEANYCIYFKTEKQWLKEQVKKVK